MNLLFPAGLALGALALPLVGLYFLKIRRTKIRVPSTLLWHELSKTERLATPFQRFQKNLLLLLQLLLLLLIVLAFARPFFEDELSVGRSLVLVLDTSASMGAADGTPTRIADAIAGAKKLVGDLGPEDEAMLILAGPVTEVKVPFTRDPALINAGLDDVYATDAEASLKEAVELALSLSKSRPGVEIAVLSDGGGEDLSTVPVGDAQVKFVPVGAGSENAGISALDIRRSPASDLDRQLFVTIEQYGGSVAAASVEVYLDGQSVGVRTADVEAGKAMSMVFDLPPAANGVLKVVLDTPGDLLQADDVAYAVVSPAADRKVLLAGIDRLTTRVLSADPRFDLDVAKGPVTATLAADYDAVVFGTPVPDGMDGLSYLVLGPMAGGPVKFGATAKAPQVMSWRRTHPVLRFVEWDNVVISRASKVTDQGGLVTIVDGDVGPLVLAGERAGGRVVELAFEPLDSDLPLRVAWPVMVLNAVGWITENAGEGEATRIISTGSPFVRRVPEGVTEARITGPDGNPVDSQLADGVLRIRNTDRAGVYTVVVGGKTTSFAANLLSERESRIAPRGTLELAAGATVEASTASLTGRREIWRELLLGACVVLLLEWLAWNRGNRA
jgi:Ca-activated chloride channel family protein